MLQQLEEDAIMRVIVASETATFWTTVERVLSRKGHAVSTANSCQELLEVLEPKTNSIPYSLLILDQDLDEKNGIEALRKVRGDKRY
ncbi:MAG TPA: response regulator, partial [Candidatus Paceibacterota bacterium]|nr:response regulator [Candidatus Paceibacterota bacterium]